MQCLASLPLLQSPYTNTQAAEEARHISRASESFRHPDSQINLLRQLGAEVQRLILGHCWGRITNIGLECRGSQFQAGDLLYPCPVERWPKLNFGSGATIGIYTEFDDRKPSLGFLSAELQNTASNLTERICGHVTKWMARGPVGRTILYWWPKDGWQRGTVARLCPRGAFSHVVAYTRMFGFFGYMYVCMYDFILYIDYDIYDMNHMIKLYLSWKRTQ